ncbi:MAG: hypothetical protein A4E72_00815 [Syntrophus sp. PtaU1.Bin208]|nr:MAG: hypothetical protein A4E72_00815 [Syntrophus sp. PtaU1.Bin208]
MVLFRFQVREHADLFHGVVRQILRFIDDQGHPFFPRELLQKKRVKEIEKFGLVAGFGRKFEFLADHFEELCRRNQGLVDHAHLDVLLDLVQQKIDQGRFPGADFPCNDDEPFALHDGVFQMGVGVLVDFAHEQIGGVRSQVKGIFFQAVE